MWGPRLVNEIGPCMAARQYPEGSCRAPPIGSGSKGILDRPGREQGKIKPLLVLAQKEAL
jgi:hypothetical protein